MHGWLDRIPGEASVWQGTLGFLEKERGPWYGPSFGFEPEMAGCIQAQLLPSDRVSMETRIRVNGEDDDWQPPDRFLLGGVGH